jgi:hypothetical protein
MRVSRLMLALPLVLAAAVAPQGPLPVPPIPPIHPPTDGPAPIPDRNVAAPSAPLSDGPKITPQFVRVPTYPTNFDYSQGYVSGSRQQEEPADRRLMPSPGFNIELPFK